jgi:hypothetical protein
MSQLIEISNQLKELQSRGEVAAQEQARIFRQAFVSKGEPRVPKIRREVAAQEQMRILQQGMGV